MFSPTAKELIAHCVYAMRGEATPRPIPEGPFADEEEQYYSDLYYAIKEIDGPVIVPPAAPGNTLSIDDLNNTAAFMPAAGKTAADYGFELPS